MKTATLDATVRQTTIAPAGKPIPVTGNVNRLNKPTGIVKEYAGKGGKLPEPIKPPTMAPVQANGNGKSKGKGKAKGRKVGTVAITPKGAIALKAEYQPQFSVDCLNWLTIGKTGQMRVVDVPVIAAHLQAKREKFIMNEFPFATDRAETDGEIAKRKEGRETLKKMRASFRKCTDAVKAKWIAEAKPIFNRTLREFLKKTAPMKKAFHDDRFETRRAELHMTKKGLVHVGMKATCDKFVE